MAETTKTTRKPRAPRPKQVKQPKAAKPANANAQYEAMFLFGSGAASDLDATQKTVRGILERHGAEILVLKKWDERKLAYELNKQKRGVYIIAYYTAPGASVGAIERDVNLSEDVLRVLISRADHLNKTEMEAVEPQPIQIREERAPWDRPEAGGYGGGGGRGGYDRPPRDDRGGDRSDRPAGADRPPPRRRDESEEAAPQA